MADEKVGFGETVSMAIGGMVGGGIFAALGIVAAAADTLTWLAFVVAGVIALCSGYSFVRLNRLIDGRGGPMTYTNRLTGRTTLAGMLGWTSIIGYIGTMALYAFAFGGYFSSLFNLTTWAGIPIRSVVSFLVVAAFVGLNTVGAHTTGRLEDVLVGLKLLVLLVFGIAGVYYAGTHGQLTTGFAHLGIGPVIGAGVAFVAFEGWELLFYDQDSIRNPERTVPRGVYVSIVAATVLYVLVGVVTTNLLSALMIKRHADTALAIAAEPFFGVTGFVVISLAALFSTASALNATLFSAARLSKKMVRDDFLPNRLSSIDNGEPIRPLLVLGAFTAALTSLGTLNAISSFASLAFITIFGATSALAVTRRDSMMTTLVPAVGMVGSTSAAIALLYHLYTSEFPTFVLVMLLVIGVVAVELLYFERDVIEPEFEHVEKEM